MLGALVYKISIRVARTTPSAKCGVDVPVRENKPDEDFLQADGDVCPTFPHLSLS